MVVSRDLLGVELQKGVDLNLAYVKHFLPPIHQLVIAGKIVGFL
jgi:hypothetical protein